MRSARSGRPVPPMTEEALAAAFGNMKPSQRLALVEKAVRTEAESRRRRRRLARASRYNPTGWLIVLLAGILCGGVGMWNYHVSGRMLSQLEARAAALPASGAEAVPGDGAWRAAGFAIDVRDLWNGLTKGMPSPVLPLEGPQRAAAISEHRQRYATYQVVGAALTAVGGAVFVGSSLMLLARRE